MTAYTNVTADDWVLADPVVDAGECANCGRAVQRCQHAPGCSVWIDADPGSFCPSSDLIDRSSAPMHDPLERHRGDTTCCCYPGPCAGHLPERLAPPASPRHPWGIPCNEPSFHGNAV